jgi:hypothetical protein
VCLRNGRRPAGAQGLSMVGGMWNVCPSTPSAARTRMLSQMPPTERRYGADSFGPMAGRAPRCWCIESRACTCQGDTRLYEHGISSGGQNRRPFLLGMGTGKRGHSRRSGIRGKSRSPGGSKGILGSQSDAKARMVCRRCTAILMQILGTPAELLRCSRRGFDLAARRWHLPCAPCA